MILGASRYYVRSIISAKELGYKVLATDKNAEAEGFQYSDYHEAVDITDVEGSINVAKKYKIDGVVALNDFGVQTAAAIAEELNLVGISSRVAKCVTNKAWMRKRWEEAGIPSPRFRIVKNLEEAYDATSELKTWPLILKPADSRGGASRGVTTINNKDGLRQAFEFAQSFYKDKTVIIEEFLYGIEHSMETLTYKGQTYILAVSDKAKTPMPYRVDKSVIYPTELSGEKFKELQKVAKMAVQALGINVGAAHVELCTTKDGPKLFEVGARCGGGGTPDPIVPFISGVEMLKEIVRIKVGEKPENLKPLYTKGCVYRFITPRPGVVKKIEGIENINDLDGILDFGLFINEGDEIKKVRTGGDRSGFIIAGADTREAAIELADKAESKIKIEYK